METKVKHKNLALLLLAGAQFLVVLDATIVNIALPAVSKALHFSNAANLQWIITAYTLAFGGLLLLGGRLADLFGRRRIFITGTLLFAIASLACGIAQNSGEIIAFRVLQGIGAALLSPAALSLVLNIFKEGKERNFALGVWSGVAAGGGAVGLLLGGILTQYANWRWVFLVNVPVGLLIAFFSLRMLPKLAEKAKNRSIDLVGAATVTGGLMTLVYAFVKAGDYGWTSGKTIGLITTAVALLIAFVINESLVKKPLVDLKIFRNRNISISNLIQLPVTAAIFGTFFYLSLYLQQILHYSPVKSGIASLPFTIFLALTAGLTSRFVARIQPRVILTIAPLVMASGLFYLSRLPVDGDYWTNVFPGIALLASGVGATFVAITLAATGGVPERQSGLASGLINTSQQIGGALGLAILTILSTSRTKAALVSSHSTSLAAVANASVAGYRHAFTAGAYFAIGASVLALVGLRAQKVNADDTEEILDMEAETIPVMPGV